MIEDNLILRNGKFILDDSSKEVLHKNKVWAMLIDNNGDRIWGFDLPKEIDRIYILEEELTREDWELIFSKISIAIFDLQY